MAEELEQIIGKLLLPDNEQIKEGTTQLKVAANDPGMVPALCHLLGSSTNVQIRQYSAILLKNKFKSKTQWTDLDAQVSQTIRQNILQVLLQEPEMSVCKSICQLIGVIARHDLPDGKWPELFNFLQTYITSQESKQREIGMYVLHTLMSRCGEELVPHFDAILQLCYTTLDDQDNSKTQFHSIQTLTELVPLLNSEQMKPFQQQVPKLLTVITTLIGQDEELATEAMEVFDELAETEISVIAPHIKSVVEFCLQIGANTELGDPLRVKGLSFIMTVTRQKKKAVVRQRLIVPILNVLFPVMCQMPPDDEEDLSEEAETRSPPAVAGQVLDNMSLHLPPSKFIHALMRLVDPALVSTDPLQRRAGYMAMAVAAEGSADHIMSKLMKPWLTVVYKGLGDPDVMVRNSALFALGQFSEHLQPEITKYSSELLPVLFEHLGKGSQDVEKDPRGITKTYYALETFVENLGEDILPYLPQLMEYLLTAISSSPSTRAKELAISALAATANAAEKQMVPYFPHIVELFKSFLVPMDNEQQLRVQVQALDTLGVLARTLKEHFEPLAVDCMNVGLKLMDSATDPDLRRCIFGLFAALSTILKDSMAPHLEVMVKNMITSVKSTEGVTAHYNQEESQLLDIFEENVDSEMERRDDVEGISVENSYMLEKEDACTSLGELALNTGVCFMQYMEECYTELSALHDYPNPDVRRSAVTGVSQFCQAVSQVAKAGGEPVSQTALYSMLHTTVPKYLDLVREDTNRQVVMDTLEELKALVEKVGAPVLQGDNMVDKFLLVVKHVMMRKTRCQDYEDEADDDDDEMEAELDSMLIEDGGELLPAVAKVIGGQAFAPYFAGFLPELFKKTKRSSSVADRSFGVGTMAECLEAMGEASGQFADQLYPVFTSGLSDQDEEVRSNSVYALGVLSFHGGQHMYSRYPHVLKLLSDLMHREKDKRCLDNICGAVCRLITAKLDSVPIPRVLPVVLKCLPLKEDHDEYTTVFKCLTMLYDIQNTELISALPQLVNINSQILCTRKLPDDKKALVTELTQRIHHDHPDIVQSVMSSLPEQQVSKLQHCLQVANGNS